MLYAAFDTRHRSISLQVLAAHLVEYLGTLSAAMIARGDSEEGKYHMAAREDQ